MPNGLPKATQQLTAGPEGELKLQTLKPNSRVKSLSTCEWGPQSPASVPAPSPIPAFLAPPPIQISFLMAVWLQGLRSLSLEPGPVLPAPAPAAPRQSPLQASGSEGRQETPSRLNPDVPGYPQPLNSQTCQVCPAPTTFNHFHPAPHLYLLSQRRSHMAEAESKLAHPPPPSQVLGFRHALPHQALCSTGD